jgi:hypothetical protein
MLVLLCALYSWPQSMPALARDLLANERVADPDLRFRL